MVRPNRYGAKAICERFANAGDTTTGSDIGARQRGRSMAAPADVLARGAPAGHHRIDAAKSFDMAAS
jgi:hypothetical protein